MESEKKKLAYVIKRIRTDLGYSQINFAKRAGLSRSFLSQLESGKRGISWSQLCKVAAAFGFPPEFVTILASVETQTGDQKGDDLFRQLQEVSEKAYRFYISLSRKD